MHDLHMRKLLALAHVVLLLAHCWTVKAPNVAP